MGDVINAVVIETSSRCCYGSRVFRLSFVMCLFTASACSSVPTERTPAGALSLFLESMGEAEDNPAARARAFSLLSRDTRESLAQRARLAGALSGRRFAPWEMIVEGRYRLRFRPRERRGFETRVQGNHAIVVVHGEGRSERAEVTMVREADKWRVQIHVPDTTASRGAAT